MTSPLRDDVFILERRNLFTEGSDSRGRTAAGLEDKNRIFTSRQPLKENSKTSDSENTALLYSPRKRRLI